MHCISLISQESFGLRLSEIFTDSLSISRFRVDLLLMSDDLVLMIDFSMCFHTMSCSAFIDSASLLHPTSSLNSSNNAFHFIPAGIVKSVTL